MANMAAYCRVSTDKEDQLNSLETQKQFFEEYAKKKGHNLVKIYADEGISGTRLKNRFEFQKLMKDANHGLFEMVITKDISRVARNTVDFLESIRKLKDLNIKVIFLTANMTSEDSELTMTFFAALAQEESNNTSKRVKFGKRKNAENGRVPNFVFGYDKTIGDYFNLTINEAEALTIKRIYDMYVNQGYGEAKISQILNNENIKTKRNCQWTQHAIARILKNELYTGKIINGKEEVEDFLTSKRTVKNESEWIIHERLDLRLIEPSLYKKAQDILKERFDSFHMKHERHSNKYLFSTLIKCADCGYSFRRTVHTYKNTYVRWVCSGRNAKGTDSCVNNTVLDEAELLDELINYFKSFIGDKEIIIKSIRSEFIKRYKRRDNTEQHIIELRKKLSDLQKSRQKHKDMYEDDVISREEMRAKMKEVNINIEKVENELNMISRNLNKSDLLDTVISDTFKTIEDIISMDTLTNAQLKQVIDKIEVSREKGITVYLRLFEDIGLDETSPFTHDRT